MEPPNAPALSPVPPHNIRRGDSSLQLLPIVLAYVEVKDSEVTVKRQLMIPGITAILATNE